LLNPPPPPPPAPRSPELFDIGKIEDVTALWYIVLCIVLTSLLFALGQRLSRIELRVWRLESDLKKLSADQQVVNYCVDARIDANKGKNCDK
jgi:hypothetical protein